ncbi:MAG: TetR/AcrR family transcriptional regulator [Solirubrobacterales bacterium]|nr:TetR/AcrR family transcriptional regulator [Solirubrobacterales bacterium]MBV9334886.1 TetR/AcrR family transcriptional regulator [Solirubrobacterales bacterium]
MGSSLDSRLDPTDGLTPAGRRILNAASELFYTQGINAIGVETIARTAGVTKKTLYDRFSSKEALVAAYLTERRQRWQEWLEDSLEPLAPAARPLGVFDSLHSWLEQAPRRGCAFVNAAAELTTNDTGRDVVMAEKAWMRDLYTRLVAETGRSTRDAKRLGAQLFMLHEGANVAYVLNGDDTAVATARAAAETLLTQR